MKTRAQLTRSALLLIAAVVLVNILGRELKFRLDLTEDQRYTLTPSTIQMLKDLPETVTITAYYTEDMPALLATVGPDMKDMLTEYEARSGGNVAFEFIDPNDADSLEQKAQREGVQYSVAETVDKDKAENMQVYMGLVVRMGDRRSVVPVVQQGASLEWVLSSALREVSILEKPSIGLVQGHGEVNELALSQLKQSMNTTYLLEIMAIYDTVRIHSRFAALILLDPKDSIPPMQLRQLHDFASQGRGVVIAYSAVESDLGVSPMVGMRSTGLETWLEKHGVHIEQHVVIDANCGQIQMMQPGVPYPVPMAFPYFPRLSSFGVHPVSSGMDGVQFQFSAPLAATVDSTWHFMPLALTSDQTGVLPLPARVDPYRRWQPMDFLAGQQVVAAAVERKLGGNSSSRIVVFSDGNFCTSGFGQQMMQLPEGNIDFMVNAIDWVTGNTGLLDLRGKEVRYRPLDEVSDTTRTLMKSLNLLAPIMICIGYGLFRIMWWRKRQRKQRMAPDHVR